MAAKIASTAALSWPLILASVASDNKKIIDSGFLRYLFLTVVILLDQNETAFSKSSSAMKSELADVHFDEPSASKTRESPMGKMEKILNVVKEPPKKGKGWRKQPEVVPTGAAPALLEENQGDNFNHSPCYRRFLLCRYQYKA